MSIRMSLVLVVGVVLMVNVETVKGSSSIPMVLDQLTKVETLALAELRELVKDVLQEDYMSENVYLAKWLLENKFDVQDAVVKLREHLEWRQQEKISIILNENWDDMHSMFPYSRKTKDKTGRPLLYLNVDQWYISKFLTENQTTSDHLGRYLVKMLEESEAEVRQLRAEGSNVTQYNLIVNMGGYSNEKHMCMQCLYFYRNIGQLLASHFPLSTEKNFFVNVPLLFKMAFSFLSEENQEFIFLYGQDQNQWEPVLLEFIDRRQVPEGLLENSISVDKDNSEGYLQWNIEL